jgi:aminoglycoside phosphotransferase (APT) family kinase protein
VIKSGDRVRPSEEYAMRLVRQYTSVPIPNPVSFEFKGPSVGEIRMSYVQGITLESCWLSLEDDAKLNLCNQIWATIQQLRQIPKPSQFEDRFLCYADGTLCNDVLVKDLEYPPRPLLDDESVRRRIAERYHHYNGRRYTREEIFSMLPNSTASVFTHADMSPRNILVDKNTLQITGVLDWECAGWYPDYWEYVNIWKEGLGEYDWAKWMDSTNPLTWRKHDIAGIKASRRVLIG